MTTIFQTSSSYGPTINAISANGDTYILPAGITVASTSSALSANFNGNILIAGSAIGTSAAISTSSIVNISITATGYVGSASHVFAIALNNGGVVSNAGTIGGGSAILSFGSLDFSNTGTIQTYDSWLVVGGAANDTVRVFNSGTIAVTGSGSGFSGSSEIDIITNSGTMTGDVTTGNGNDQIVNYGHIYGNIDLGSENDTLYTDLSALGGPYTIQGGSGTDAVVNTDNDHTVSFNLADNGFEIFYGGAMASYVYGGTATAGLTFVGKGAADAFIGGSGADVVIGGAGGDYLDGGAGGSNTLSYSGSLLGVTVNLGAATASGGDAAGDYFLNFQNLNGSAAVDVLVGDGGANTLYGDAGNDYMFGSSGADLLIGAAGNDYLSGGAGNDIFYYGATGYGNDEIVDFTIGQDTMYISTSIAANFAGLTIFQYLADTYVGAGGNYFHLDNTVATNLHASDFVFF